MTGPSFMSFNKKLKMRKTGVRMIIPNKAAIESTLFLENESW